ncbi:Chromatin structure-remodeling complex protein rsc9 [Umbelopsis nana]
MSQPEDAIDRTPEYNRFMGELREFHKRHGTFLQAEPVLGGKKLDLLKIWQRVQEAGGFEQVTQSRTWKQVGDPFNFPVTCTNSAYVLKAVYIKYMLGYEEEKVWGRTWVPPKDALEVNQRPGQLSSSPVPPKPPVAYKPTNTVRRTATAFAPQPTLAQYAPQPQMIQQRLPPNHPQTRTMMPFDDENFRNRITLSLKSRLPNEVDWAFNNLVRLSFVSDRFNFEYMPQLLDSLIQFAQPFFQTYVFAQLGHAVDTAEATQSQDHGYQVNGVTPMEGVEQENETSFVPDENYEYTSPSDPALSQNAIMDADDHLFNSKEYQEGLERVLQVLHILRNASFLDSNWRILSQHEILPNMLINGLAFFGRAQYIELSRHCLDILENIAPSIILKSRLDPCLVSLSRLVFTNDKALILGATKALTRIAVTEVNERIFAIPDLDLLKRMIEFLFVNDEELLAATLDYLYQHTCLHSDLGTELLNLYPGNLIALLTSFLYYNSSIVPNGTLASADIVTITEPQGMTPQPPKGPSIPDLTNYAQLDEPYRCLGWVKDMLESAGPERTLLLGEVYKKYQAQFGISKPLGIKEFYTVLKIALPQANRQDEQDLENIALQNIKYRNDPDVGCSWQDCKETFATEKELHRHILDVHVPKSDQATEYTCKWMSCARFTTPVRDRQLVLSHLRVHFAPKPKQAIKQKRVQITSAGAIPIDDSEVSGVPLSAALLLRNLVKEKRHHVYFLPYEQDITMTGIHRPKLERYTVAVITALQS